MLFLTSMWIKIALHMTLGILSLSQNIKVEKLNCNEECKEFCYGCDIKSIYYLSIILNFLVCSFYLLLSSLLLCTHCKNYLANRTTSERLSRGFKQKKIVK